MENMQKDKIGHIGSKVTFVLKHNVAKLASR